MAAGIGYALGDFLATPFRPGSVDLVTSVASLHHMDAAAALRRMSELLAPGGVLASSGWPGTARRARPARSPVPPRRDHYRNGSRGRDARPRARAVGQTDRELAGDGREWPLGNIQMVGKSNWAAMKGEEPRLTKLVPRLALEEVARHAVDFWLTTEDVPKPDNRVTVDRDGHVHLAYRQTNDAEADGLYRDVRTIINHVGIFFPSIGAVNPALTVMANAIRVGEHLLQWLA